MLTFTILPFVFATLAVATASLTSREVPDTALLRTCNARAGECGLIMNYACTNGASIANSAACRCNNDITVSVPLFKCYFDNCNATDARDEMQAWRQECGAPNIKELEASIPSTLSQPLTAFSDSMPECGKRCINQDTAPDCAPSLDFECVCASRTTPTNQANSMERCIFDNCTSSDAAASLATMLFNCDFRQSNMSARSFPPNDQLGFPYRGYADELDRVLAATVKAQETADALHAMLKGQQPSSAQSYRRSSIIGVAVIIWFALALLL